MTPVSNLAAEMSSPASRRTAALALGLVVLVTIISQIALMVAIIMMILVIATGE